MILRIYLFLIFGFFSAKGNHAIYISVIEMGEEKLSIKVFSDDLQDAIRNYSEEYVESGIDDFVSKNQKQISGYFNEKCELNINQKSVPLTLNDFKVEGDATFLYFSFGNIIDWSSISINANYFMELFPNQSNVVTIKIKESKYFARLTKKDAGYSLILD